MKLPSLNLLYSQAKETFLRFPFVLISALIGTFAMMRVIGFSREYYEFHSQAYFNIVMTCSLGIPLFIAFALYAEAKKFGKGLGLLVNAIPAAVLLVFYFTLSKETDIFDIGRYFLYLTAFHLLVSFSSHLFREKNQIDFWDFNQTIFLRFILSALYSGVLYAGLAIALLAFDKLFDMHVDGKRYGQLFFFIAGIFNTWFFCSGVPSISGEKTEFKYPKGLKIFAQYVLLPIVVVYVVILYMYLFKIIFQWSLPMGWVSYLVIGFSTAGIFSLLLVYPLKDEVRWMRIFSRLFFAALIPQIVLLFLAISRRTSEYGMTERRYYVIVLALWLAVTTVYYLITNFRNIKYIPVTLCVIAVVTSLGPWSAFNMSLNSQLSRLEEVLKKNAILADGKIVKTQVEITDNELSDVRSILEFLIERRKLDRIQPWFGEDLANVSTEKIKEMRRPSSYFQIQGIMELMGLKSVKTQDFKTKKYINVVTKDMKVIDVKDFSEFIHYESYPSDTTARKYGKDTISINLDREHNIISLIKDNDSLRFNLNPVLKTLDTETPEPQTMTLDAKGTKLSAKLRIKNFDADKNNDSIRISGFQGYILLK